jgi:hypothetical protein
MLQHFVPQTHRNELSDLYIPLYAKTEVQRNVSWLTFYGNRTGPTRA